MPSDVFVLCEQNGFAKTLATSVNDNTPVESGLVPLLNERGRLDNSLLEDTTPTALSLRWKSNLKISDGSNGIGPDGETIPSNVNSTDKWVAGKPVLYGFENGKTIGVRVDAARNSDNVGEIPIHTGENSLPNRVVRTDSNGYIQMKYMRSSSPNTEDSAGIGAFIVIGQNNDGYYRKTSISSVKKFINLDEEYYEIDLSSITANRAQPIKFSSYTNVMITTSAASDQFNMKLEAQPAKSNTTPVFTICSVRTKSNSFVQRILNKETGTGIYVWLKTGFKYKIHNIDRNLANRASIVSTAIIEDGEYVQQEAFSSSIVNGFWAVQGTASIISSTLESFMRTSHPAYSISGFGTTIKNTSSNTAGTSTKVAREDHTHYYIVGDHPAVNITGFGTSGSATTVSRSDHDHPFLYNIRDPWLREFNDDAHFKIYGNTRQVAFRTDGITQYATGVGNSAFVWMYGGDALANRIMYLTNGGDLYANRLFNIVYADIAECFVSSSKNNSKEWINRLVEINEDGTVQLAKENSKTILGVVSNSYGQLLNGAQDEVESGIKVPVALIGTVYVEAEDIDKGRLGDFICSGKNGKARINFTGSEENFGKIIGKKDNMYKILIK